MDTVSSAQQYNCVHSSHNFRQPHVVSSTTWYCHLQEAHSEEERQRMQNAKFDGLNPSSAHRARGTAARRWNNVLPA